MNEHSRQFNELSKKNWVTSLDMQVLLILCQKVKSYKLLSNAITISMVYGTRRFNTAFTRALQSYPSLAESTQFLVLITISLRSIIIMSSHLRLGFSEDLLLIGLPDKIFKAIWPNDLIILSSKFNHPDYIR